MRFFIVFCLFIACQTLTISAGAQEFDITEIATAQAAYDEDPTDAHRETLLDALARYRGEATVETVNAHLVVMANDSITGEPATLRESAHAAAMHLAPVAEIVPRQYVDSGFVAAVALFNSRQDPSAMTEMAAVEGFARHHRATDGTRPDWATDLQWKSTAWRLAMEAYLKRVDEDHPSDRELDAIVDSYDDPGQPAASASQAVSDENALPRCPGRMRQTPKLKYPSGRTQRGVVGAVILEFEFDPDGNVINPKVLASVPENEFDEKSLRVVTQWSFRPQKRRDVGVKCRLERTDVVQPLIFFLD
ncbi:MAG: energy transducer TonB [Pseudomonadota bacterium]